MKACVTSTGNDISADIDPRFGRCRVFLFVDTDTMECEAVENPAMMAGGGAGTQAAQLVANKGATAVLTGNAGPNAFSALNAAGIDIYVGLTGTAKDAVEKLKKGGLKPISEASVGRHFGGGGGRGSL
ncbi:MAG: NifB/NifX family molybdenum-iron cluster-binding protein [Deltaproteobacteria bacterium]|nr:NifB/NifX family molybdenum-iron cluster-binding protein [Deltaproteobacteria bacterium]MBW2183202.1 NifB/NifX family molybdenum-iron cluster-binding protein [Deltaproteobacteria bacterium]